MNKLWANPTPVSVWFGTTCWISSAAHLTVKPPELLASITFCFLVSAQRAALIRRAPLISTPVWVAGSTHWEHSTLSPSHNPVVLPSSPFPRSGATCPLINTLPTYRTLLIFISY